jgi:hypothetical protein
MPTKSDTTYSDIVHGCGGTAGAQVRILRLELLVCIQLADAIGGDEAGQCLTDRLDNKVIPGVRDCQDAKGKGGTWLCERLQVNLCTSLNRNLAVNHDDR